MERRRLGDVLPRFRRVETDQREVPVFLVPVVDAQAIIFGQDDRDRELTFGGGRWSPPVRVRERASSQHPTQILVNQRSRLLRSPPIEAVVTQLVGE